MLIVPVDRNVVAGSSKWNILQSTRSLVRRAAFVVLQHYKSGDISNNTDCKTLASTGGLVRVDEGVEEAKTFDVRALGVDWEYLS